MKAIVPMFLLAVAAASNGMEMSVVSNEITSLIGEAFIDALILLPFFVAIKATLAHYDRLAILKIEYFR